MRLFLAIQIPDEAKQPILDAQRHIENGAPHFFKWVPADQVHLTLYFLGEMQSDEQVATAAGGLEACPFDLAVGGLTVLPDPRVPRILAAGLHGDTTALKTLQRRLADTVFPIAAFKETRGYSPHVTFGRLKRGMPGNAKSLKRTLAGATVQSSGPFRIDSFDLVLSRPQTSGPKYETLHRFPLA